MAYWMCKFVLEMRKQNGTKYPPKSCLYQIVCCFKRHFEANGIHNVNILSTQEPIFGNFRRTLDAEMQYLHCLAQLRQAEPISESEEVTLWKASELGKQ